MADVTHGADVAGLRQFGTELTRNAQRIESLTSEVNAAIARAQAWKGRDADSFRTEWTSRIRTRLTEASRSMDKAGTEAKRQADQQEQASNDTGGPTGPGTPGGPGAPPSPDKWEDWKVGGDLPWRVRWEWGWMSEEERRAFLQEYANEIAERTGLDVPVKINFEDLPDEHFLWFETVDRRGSWDPSTGTLTLDTSDIKDMTEVIQTLSHEMRHGYQWEVIQDYQTYERNPQGSPWTNPNVSPEQAKEWRDNWLYDYKHPDDPGVSFSDYENQPIEKDASAAEKSGTDQLNWDEFNRIKKESQE